MSILTLSFVRCLPYSILPSFCLNCSGFNSELCAVLVDCPSRIGYLVAAGVISFILTGVALAGLLLHIGAIKGFMPFICGFLALWWGITAGVASSPRTYTGGVLNVGMLSAWLAFLAALAAAIGAAAEEGWFSGTGAAPVEATTEEDVEAGKARAGSESTEGEVQEPVPTPVPVVAAA